MTRFPEPGNPMFTGSIVALVTPFTDGGDPDYSALDALVDFHLRERSDGLVVAGTTGESATLGQAEFEQILTAVVRRVNGAIPVLAGTGSAATASAVEHTRRAGGLGADGVLVVTPYYNRPTQSGLEAHFNAVADASSVPVVLYNVPARTAIDLHPATVQRLAAHPRIVGIKEALRDAERIADLAARGGPDFIVLSGDDPSCLEAMERGARGVVSVAANVVPAAMHDLCRAADAKDWGRARQIDGRLRALFEALALESNPIPVKWALFEMDRIGPQIRLPLTPLAESCRETLRRCLRDLRLIPEC
jgi:4-hydroxy-tetrahydrodipicolinate synthase